MDSKELVFLSSPLSKFCFKIPEQNIIGMPMLVLFIFCEDNLWKFSIYWVNPN